MTFVESTPQKDMIRFCQRWQIREFFFGSASRLENRKGYLL